MATRDDIAALLADPNATPWEFPRAPLPSDPSMRAALTVRRTARAPDRNAMGALADLMTSDYPTEPDLMTTQKGVRDDIPEGYAVNDAGEIFNKQTGVVMPQTPRPNVLPLSVDPSGKTVLAMPKLLDIAGNMQIGGLLAPPGRGALSAGLQRTAPARTMASPDEIRIAAAESSRGITQPELRKMYDRLGLTGGAPSELAMGSLAAQHAPEARYAAQDLKLQDRAVLNTLTKKERTEYAKTGFLPSGDLLPSQEAALPGLTAFKPIKKEVARAEKEFDTNVARGIKPSVFDLSPQTLVKLPDVPQFPLPRAPEKMTERLEPSMRGGMARLERAAGNAPPENWGWYNLMQARDLFNKIHGPEKGPQAFDVWLDSLAGTSMVNPIDNNIRSSTWYLQQVLQGKPLPEVMQILDPDTNKAVRTMVGGPPPGYGAKSQIQHADRVKEYMTHSYDPVSNPKPISYRMNLSGNWVPRTVDTHDIRNMVGMKTAKQSFGEDAGLLPGEYSFLENLGGRAAQRAGAPNAAQQAATWVGGGEYTGLKSYPAPLLEALNRRAHVTAKIYDITPEQALTDAFSGKRPLLSVGGFPVGAPGELARQDDYQ